LKKWIAISLILLVTIGSFYPCCLDDDCASETAAAQHGESNKEQGYCSPLSACASCAGSVEIQTVQISVQEVLPALPQYNGYRVSDREGTYPVLFQPPRSC
jgi:hypothetical protein